MEEQAEEQITQRRLFDDGDHSSGSDSETLDEVVSSQTEEKPYGSMSKSDFFRKADQAISVFKKSCSGWQEEVDVSLHLLLYDRKEPCIDRRKFRIKLDPGKDTKRKEPVSTSSQKTIRRKAHELRDILLTCREPELVLEHIFQKTVLSVSLTSLLLQDMGVVIPECFAPKVNLVKERFNAVRDELCLKRTGNTRVTANRAAVRAADILSEKGPAHHSTDCYPQNFISAVITQVCRLSEERLP